MALTNGFIFSIWLLFLNPAININEIQSDNFGF